MSEPASPSSTNSSPRLNSATLAVLNSFLSSKMESEQRFKELIAARGDFAGDTIDHDSVMSVEEFRQTFPEDWQLSQFWYMPSFATRLAHCIHSLCSPTSIVAFICCPTAFVAFQHLYPLEGTRLLEIDRRFAALSPAHYVFYDLDEPDCFPALLKGAVDIAIVDPPFLNEATNRKLIQTLRHLLRPSSGRLLLLTSLSVEPLLKGLYDSPPVGPLMLTALRVEHDQLANDYACWGSWDGAKILGSRDDNT